MAETTNHIELLKRQISEIANTTFRNKIRIDFTGGHMTKEFCKTLPPSPCVYMLIKDDKVIYIGKSSLGGTAKKRLTSYFTAESKKHELGTIIHKNSGGIDVLVATFEDADSYAAPAIEEILIKSNDLQFNKAGRQVNKERLATSKL